MSFGSEETISCFLDKSNSDNNSQSIETSDETTLSLPSISLLTKSEAKDPTATAERPLTIRDSERQLDDLRRENFGLKLRIYCLEKSCSGGANSGLSDFNEFSKEFIKKEKTFQKEVKQQKHVISDQKHVISDQKHVISDLQQKNKELSEECVRLAAERTDGESGQSRELCLQLMTHLFSFCQLFRNDDNLDDSRRHEQQLCRLLNSSEDLLNCCSVLISKRVKDPNSGINRYKSESESEDLWSEPDRDVSRARIGLSLVESNSQSTKRSKPKRHSIGMSSSLGLIDFKETKDSEMQTEVTCFANKSIQVVEDDNKDDNNCCRLLSSEKEFPEFMPKTTTTTTDDKSSSVVSLFTYYASLSPMSRRQKGTTEGRQHNSLSSSVSSLKRTTTETTLSPDLGIESESNERPKLWIEARDLRRVNHCLNESIDGVTSLTTDDDRSRVLEVLKNCLNLCEKVTKNEFKSEKNLFKKLEKLRKSKKKMEKEISKQLWKTNDLLLKTKSNLN